MIAATWRVARTVGGRPGQRAASVALGAATILAGVGLLTVSGYLISRAAQRPDILELGVAIATVRALAIARGLLRYGERLVSHDLAFRALAALRTGFFTRLVALVPGGLPGLGRADLLSRFVADVDRLQDVHLRAVGPVAAALVASVLSVAIAAVLLPAAGLALAAGLVVAGSLVPWATRAAARSAGRRQAAERSALAATVVEVAAGASEIVLAGREREWIARADAAGTRLAAIQRRDALSGGLAAGLLAALTGLTATLVAVAAIDGVRDGRLDGVLLAAVILLAMAAFEAVRPLGAAAMSIDACESAAERLDAVLAVAPPVRDPETPVVLGAAGPLEIREVRFRYGDDAPWLLDGVDLALPRGRAVALVGRSGAGKTTLAELLVRFREPTEGRVLLGAVDLAAASQDDVRAAVCLGAQEAHLFTTSLRENLVLARPGAGDDELAAALARAGLGTWLASLPEGLGTELGEQGALVSGGQRRRIAAARLLLSPAPFLVADEPGAHLDAAGAAALMGELAREARESGRGVLVIAHEPHGLDAFDEILALREGRVAPHQARR